MTPSSFLETQQTCNGVFLEILGSGVLLTGPSGIGKSELALGLIDRGHCLIADDVVVFSRRDDNKVLGICPEVLQDFLEVRGLGVIDVRAIYGDTAIKPSKELSLIIDLIELPSSKLSESNPSFMQGYLTENKFSSTPHPASPARGEGTREKLFESDRLTGLHRQQEILGIAFPHVSLPVAPGRPLPILVEAAVRNQMLKSNGYDPSLAFQIKQQQLLQGEHV